MILVFSYLLCLFQFTGVFQVFGNTTDSASTDYSCDLIDEIPIDIWGINAISSNLLSSQLTTKKKIIRDYYGIKYDLTILTCLYKPSDLIVAVTQLDFELVDRDMKIHGVRISDSGQFNTAQLIHIPKQYNSQGQKEDEKYVLEISADIAFQPWRIGELLKGKIKKTFSDLYRKRVEDVRMDTLTSMFDTGGAMGWDQNIISAKLSKVPARFIKGIEKMMDKKEENKVIGTIYGINIFDGEGISFAKLFADAKDTSPINRDKEQNIDLFRYQNQAVLKLLSGQFNEATYYFQNALDLDGYNIKLYNGMALSYLAQGDLENAQKYLKRAVDLHPNNPYAYSNLGVHLFEMEKDQESIDSLKASLHLEPGLIGLNAYIGYAYTSLGQYEQSLVYLKKAEMVLDSNAEFDFVIADAYALSGSLQESIPYYKKSIALDRTFIDAHINLTTSYIELGMYQEAIDHLLGVLELAGSSPLPHTNLAVAYFSMGNYRKSLEHFSIARNYYLDMGDDVMVQQINSQVSVIEEVLARRF